MMEYDHKKIEEKWQKIWEEEKYNQAEDNSKKPKFYSLIEFPYPSADGMHVGHIRSNTAMDIISRKRRSEGFNVLYPIGWDAFGLPTENYALKTGIHPSIVTKQNTDVFRRQLKSLGFSFDWSREVNTTDPKYYRWTQWIFLQLFKQGLAYKSKALINWCPKDKIGLANEEVINGKCERCGTLVEKREKEQWMLAITKYADRLEKDLDDVDYLPQIKAQQRNWIGKSEGAEIDFPLDFKHDPKVNENRGPKGERAVLKIFTTRPDTIFGATYLVLSPEHLWITLAADDDHDVLENKEEVRAYVEGAKKRTDIERTAENKEKTGVEIKGVKAINPATKEEIPIYVADYVLAHYGTGAIMAVPAHDERDFQFAQKYKLPFKEVVKDDILINSDKFDGMTSEEAKGAITKSVGGKMVTTYKLRDWIFSRQRYWGEPIPIIHCPKCGYIPVPEKDLPVVLPEVENYQPTDTGESPLAAISDWVNIKCPKCGGEAKRETDTMPNWAGSSWYFLRYIDPHNDEIFASPDKLKYWMPVDWYNGGMEHTTLHLLYSRFWNKFLFDIKAVPTSEPYQKRTSHGFILAPDGEKMSKSRGNVINPDEVVKIYGADTLRLYEMFMGPFDQAVKWSTDGILGPRRFLEKIWRFREKISDDKEGSPELKSLLQKTIKKVSEDIEAMRFNTAVSAMMILANEYEKSATISREDFQKFLILLSPFCPHIAEEIWHDLGGVGSIQKESWPQYDASLVEERTVNIVIQVNGRKRGSIEVMPDTDEEAVKIAALEMPEVSKWLKDGELKRVVFVKNKLINLIP